MAYALIDRSSGNVVQVATRKNELDSVVVVNLNDMEKTLTADEIKKVYRATTGKAPRGRKVLVNEILQTVTQTGIEQHPDKIGAVGRARVIFARMKGKPRQEILHACAEAGINLNTASTQLHKWNKEHAAAH